MTKQTIPHLELLASLLAAQLTDSISKALDDVKGIDSVTYWSDSTVVLSWIRSCNKEYKQFVESRLVEIRKLALVELWKYVLTKYNPADVPSRGTTATQLKENKLWWNGPEFLLKSKRYWPTQPCVEQEDDAELKSPPIITTSNVTLVQFPNFTELCDLSKYSSITKLHLVTAYVLRFIGNLKKRMKNLDTTDGPITSEEINNAEVTWIKHIQLPMSREANYKKVKESLKLFEDEKNIISFQGRIQEALMTLMTLGVRFFYRVIIMSPN